MDSGTTIMLCALPIPLPESTDVITFGDESSCEELIRYLFCSNKGNP